MTQAVTAVRAAIYCRKSVARGLDQEVNSLTVQRAACEEYCRSQGWAVVPTQYNDGGFTGRNTDRPAFKALMGDAAAHRFDRVVVYKLDRLSRSLADFVGTVAELERHGAGFVSVTQAFDTSSAMGRLTMGILASFASFESDLNSERTKDAIAAAKRGGRFCGGRVPFGYDAHDGRLVISEAEAVVVRELFDLYLTHQSAVGVAQLLNERSRRMKQGQRWDKGAVLRALRSPAVAGLVGTGDELHAGQHVAIVDRASWDRVQAILDDRPDQQRPFGRSRSICSEGWRAVLDAAAPTPRRRRPRASAPTTTTGAPSAIAKAGTRARLGRCRPMRWRTSCSPGSASPSSARIWPETSRTAWSSA
jgi:site-specific DNA recombinase